MQNNVENTGIAISIPTLRKDLGNLRKMFNCLSVSSKIKAPKSGRRL
jgi:hypothetical protein